LLAYVPTDSPYLGGNLEPTPNDVIDGFLQKWEPVTAALQTRLATIRTQMESQPDTTDAAHRLALSLLQELDGKLNRPGLESLGFDLQAHQVYYAIGGVFPVARITLGDAATFRATVQRVMERAGLQASEQKFEEQSYWRLGSEQFSSGGNEMPGAIYIAIRDDHLALGIIPDAAQVELLPLFLGTQKPASSDALSRLQAINSKYGFTLYLSAVVDLQLLADQFMNPDSLLVTKFGGEHATEVAALSDVCKAEFREIIRHTPRLVMGATELQPSAVAMQYVVETDSAIAQQLAGLLADVPGADMQSTRLLDFAFGINVGALRDFLREKAIAIVQAPYQCEHLQDLNEQATQGVAQLDQPMPPFVNNFRGVRASLNKLSTGPDAPASAEGLVAVHVDQPEMFVGMAQMFLPDLSGVTLVKGEPPVQLPPSVIPIPDIVAFAALSDTAIGLSIGAGLESSLLPYLDSKIDPEGKFLSLSYDTATYLDFTNEVSEAFLNEADESGLGVDGVTDTPNEAIAHEIADAVRQSYKDAADRSEVSAGFTENGLVIDSRMTFK
jgi:hypothetical protein